MGVLFDWSVYILMMYGYRYEWFVLRIFGCGGTFQEQVMDGYAPQILYVFLRMWCSPWVCRCADDTRVVMEEDYFPGMSFF